MDFKNELKVFLGISAAFLVLFFLPSGTARFDNAVLESLHLARWYAREHVILCLIPAFFIAGAIAVFVSKDSVMRYLGAKANKFIAYAVASVSGTILAVCSCTILPLFAGIYKRGAGIGPATAFLYSGPAVNILAIIITARVLGFEMGLARALGAILFSIVIGISMSLIFRQEEAAKADMPAMETPPPVRPLWQNAQYFGVMVAVLVFANWAEPSVETGLWWLIYSNKWILTIAASLGLGAMLVKWFDMKLWKLALAAFPAVILAAIYPETPLLSFSAGLIGLGVLTSTEDGETGEWFEVSWGYAKQIFPLLLIGVLVSGFLLGRPGSEGMIPSHWISGAVGGNSLFANLFASLSGALMYFATLTEVPILQGLIGNGMGKGPALALLLAGPALSLPNMLVIRSVMGNKKTAVYIGLVVVMATTAGLIYGSIFG